MIHYITTRGHAYTIAYVEKTLGRSVIRSTTYDRLLSQKSFAPGTYIFADIERLDDWERRLAAELFRELGNWAPAVRVVNDPARVRTRYSLLRALHEAGINRYDVCRADESRHPRRFPVFLREQAHHGMPLTDLIHTQDDLDARLAEFAELGIPPGSVLVIEYAAEPIRENKFCKYGAYRIGNAIIPHHVIFEDRWLVKWGADVPMEDEDRRAEAAYIHANPHRDRLAPMFHLAGIDYGRIDYGLVDGEIQVYEINTNPNINYDRTYLTALKREAYAVAEAQLLESLVEMDCRTAGPRIRLESELLAKARRDGMYKYSRRPRP